VLYLLTTSFTRASYGAGRSLIRASALSFLCFSGISWAIPTGRVSRGFVRL